MPADDQQHQEQIVRQDRRHHGPLPARPQAHDRRRTADGQISAAPGTTIHIDPRA
jgi:hypothetical protein